MSTTTTSCCGDATTHKYNNDCGIYCLAQGQDVKKLQTCLTSKSGNYNVFCNAAQNATATTIGSQVYLNRHEHQY
ncbi:hypothetical protein N7522_002067 [Penicillium canescens]|nr:hypothetical protein N7522_002067 [Penicillium canescens]